MPHSIGVVTEPGVAPDSGQVVSAFSYIVREEPECSRPIRYLPTVLSIFGQVEDDRVAPAHRNLVLFSTAGVANLALSRIKTVSRGEGRAVNLRMPTSPAGEDSYVCWSHSVSISKSLRRAIRQVPTSASSTRRRNAAGSNTLPSGHCWTWSRSRVSRGRHGADHSCLGLPRLLRRCNACSP